MRKICKILSIFIFMTSLILMGCSNTDYYFKFSNLNVVVSVNESINIFDLNIETNIKDYELISIVLENDSLVEINGNNIKAIKTGSTRVDVNVKYNKEDVITASFNLIIQNNGTTSNNNENLIYTYEITEVEDNCSILKLKVYKENEIYLDYSVLLNFEDESNLIYKRKVYNYYEIKFKTNSQFEIKIKDLFDNKEYLVEID